MDLLIPDRYLAAKWQAYVTPESLGFRFVNGLVVTNLWQLKQALLTLDEDSLVHHVNAHKNDLSMWIKEVIGDVELATVLKKQTHRWGLIVELERQMMRTVALPDYVASRWLRKIEMPFIFKTGEKAYSSKELGLCLESVSDETVEFHRQRFPNDISLWVANLIGDYQLADLLNEALNKSQMQRFIVDHVEMLEEASKVC